MENAAAFEETSDNVQDVQGRYDTGATTGLYADLVLDAVDLLVLNVESADEHVVGDVVQVAAVLQPGACHADVVRRALALHLDKNQGVLHTQTTRQFFTYSARNALHNHKDSHEASSTQRHIKRCC